MNHNMRPLQLFLNEHFTLLNAELINKQPSKKEASKLYKLANFNATASSCVFSVTFILHYFSAFLDHTLYTVF
jgi:hypothetical protein